MAKTKKDELPAITGRPSSYTDDKADSICARIADGDSLRRICAEDGPDMKTVMRWLADNASFRQQYAHAREAQADYMAEDILQIADDGRNDTYATENGEAINHDVIARSRLRVDARKWLASKLSPKKYGDKIAIGGADDLPAIQSQTTMTDEYLAFIAASSKK